MGRLLYSKSKQDPHVAAVSASNSTPLTRMTRSPPNTIIIKHANDITILGLRIRQDIWMKQEIGIQGPSQLLPPYKQHSCLWQGERLHPQHRHDKGNNNGLQKESSSSAASCRQREIGGKSRSLHTPTDLFIILSLVYLYSCIYYFFYSFNSFKLQDFLCAWTVLVCAWVANKNLESLSKQKSVMISNYFSELFFISASLFFAYWI